jgi:hypothetical protein
VWNNWERLKDPWFEEGVQTHPEIEVVLVAAAQGQLIDEAGPQREPLVPCLAESAGIWSRPQLLLVTARAWPHAGGGEATTMNVDTQRQWQRDTDAHVTARPSRSLGTPSTAAATSEDRGRPT